jgi:flagellar biosynthesis/type III secretory pathway protein FliH
MTGYIEAEALEAYAQEEALAIQAGVIPGDKEEAARFYPATEQQISDYARGYRAGHEQGHRIGYRLGRFDRALESYEASCLEQSQKEDEGGVRETGHNNVRVETAGMLA